MSERVCADCYHAEAAHRFNSRDGSYRCRVPHCWCRDFYPPEGGDPTGPDDVLAVMPANQGAMHLPLRTPLYALGGSDE